MLEQVKKQCHSLKLLGFYENAEHRSHEALSANMHPLDYLRLLLEDELLYRKSMRAKKLITRAKFRHDCDLEDFDFSYDRGITKPKLKELGALGFYHNNENLLILGRTGEGKTHLAMSLGKRLCADGLSTAFFSANLLFEEIAAVKAEGAYLKFLKRIAHVSTLILDDFGLRSYSHEEATSLMDIVEERYRKGVVIITSQVDPKGWMKLFEDPVIAEALIDRLTKPSQMVKLRGGTYRDHFAAK
jgi:DNA replication protein DnaC